MSNTIAHLAVAQRIYLQLQKYDNADVNANRNVIIQMMIDNPDAYYLGAVAPDTIGSKLDCTREDKRGVHLREDIRDADWLLNDKMAIFDKRVADFVSTHIDNLDIELEQKVFSIGYLVHLLTDKWNHKTIREALLKIANANGVQESDKDFFYMCVNDLEALDNYLLIKYPDVKQLFFEMLEKPVNYYLEGYIEKDYIEKSMNWWKNQYLSSIQTRTLKYITESDIESFIEVASNQIIEELREYSIIQ